MIEITCPTTTVIILDILQDVIDDVKYEEANFLRKLVHKCRNICHVYKKAISVFDVPNVREFYDTLMNM